jgi:hypothetical protein
VAIASGSGVLSGTTTVAAVNGVATFTNLVITGSGPHTITFTSTGLTPATSASFSVAVGAPTQLAITTQPGGAVSGVAFTTHSVLEIRDASGVLTTSTANVTVAIASGTGALSGTTTVAAVNGIATFTNLVITGSGPHTLSFTSAGLTPATSASFTVAVGAPALLAITTQPGGAVPGIAFTTQPLLEIRDASGVLTTSTASVTAAIASGSGVLSGTTTVTAVNGVASFTNLVITGNGPHTLSFTSTGLTPATSASFTVTAGAPAQLAITTQPGGAASGLAFTTHPVIEIRDAGGVLTTSTASVTVAIASGSGALSGATTIAAVNGVATFAALVITGSGPHTLTFTSTGLTPATSASFTVTVGAPTQLAVSTQPAGAVSGVAFATQPVVEIRDASGVLTSSTANVTVAIASGTGTLSGTTTRAAVNGVATFTNIAITGSGPHTLSFTSTGLTPATTATFVVTVGAPTQLAITTQPGGAVSGIAFTTSPVIQIRDASGVLTTSTAPVTATIASGSGALSGTTTVAAVNGIATFANLRITGSGPHTLTFTSSGLTPATSTSFTVAVGDATHLAVATQPAGAVSGAAFTTQPVIEIRDASGLLTANTDPVTVAIASGGGVLSGTTTVTAVNGVATFTNLMITGSGPHTLTFTATRLTAATSAPFTVTIGPATQLAVVTQPNGAVYGIPFTTQPIVQIRDANGGLSLSSASVTAAIASGSGTLRGTVTVAAVNGVATFTDLAITGSGPHTLTFTSTGLTPATSASFTVVATVATQLAITTQPNRAVYGVAFATQPIIEIRDANGNLSPSTALVTAAIASGSGTLGGTTTVTAVNGVATFTDLMITGLGGAHTLTFTSSGLTPATSASFTVTGNAPTHLVMVNQPANAVTGLAFVTQPEVRIFGAEGSLTNSTASVTASITSGGGVLSGTVTVSAVDGVAKFADLAITGTAGPHILTFTSNGLASVSSYSFNVSVGAPKKLALTTQPSGAVPGVVFTKQPVVEIRDAGGNLTTGAAAVTATLASGPPGVLSGTLIVEAVNGVATFTNLRIAGGGAYTLQFSSAGLIPATSESFNVAPIDLVAGTITTTPFNPATIDRVSLSAEVRNVGIAAATGVAWQLRIDGTTVGGGTIASLAAGATTPVTASNLGPFVEGGHTAELVLDPANTIVEVNETNNTSSQIFTVGPTPRTISLEIAGAPGRVVAVTSGATLCELTTASPQGSCDINIAATERVAAEPTPTTGFTGWSGACTGRGSCTVPAGQTGSVRANFVQVRPIDANAAAQDLMTGAGLAIADRELLDQTGNGDGIYNLGDLLAHLERTGQVLSDARMGQLLSAPNTLGRPIRAASPARRQ